MGIMTGRYMDRPKREFSDDHNRLCSDNIADCTHAALTYFQATLGVRYKHRTPKRRVAESSHPTTRRTGNVR
jgi:hypothetical protein